MKIRFQADANLNAIIVKATLRREPGIDFQTAEAARLEGIADPEVLAIAAKEGRVLVTHDRKTMPTHFAEFIGSTTCSGVLIIEQDFPVLAAVEDIILIWLASDPSEWLNRIRYLPCSFLLMRYYFLVGFWRFNAISHVWSHRLASQRNRLRYVGNGWLDGLGRPGVVVVA